MTKYVIGGRSNSRRNVYHTQTDCQTITKSEVRPVSENEIAYFELDLCEHCDPDKTPNDNGEQDRSYLKALQREAEK